MGGRGNSQNLIANDNPVVFYFKGIEKKEKIRTKSLAEPYSKWWPANVDQSSIFDRLQTLVQR